MFKESETIELKTSLGEWKEAVIALTAFANKRGGKVVIGVDDRGEHTIIPSQSPMSNF